MSTEIAEAPASQVYEAHEIAKILPLMDSEELSKLIADIAARGLIYDIILFEGKILDGRHRYMACVQAGVTPRFDTFEGDYDDAIAHVTSTNVLRRQLSDSQRSMVAARLANLRKGRPTDATPAVSQTDVAEQFAVSRSSVQRAAKVLTEGVPGLADAVTNDAVPVAAAALVAALPKEIQEQVVAEGPEAIKQAAKKAKAKPVTETPAAPSTEDDDTPAPATATDAMLTALAGGLEKVRAALSTLSKVSLTPGQRKLMADYRTEANALADWIDEFTDH